MVPDGISRYLPPLSVAESGTGKRKKGKTRESSSSTQGESEKGKKKRGDLNREVELRETKRTPAHQKKKHRGCQEKHTHTHKSLSLTPEPKQIRFSVCLAGFIRQTYFSFLLSAAFSTHSRVIAVRWLHRERRDERNIAHA